MNRGFSLLEMSIVLVIIGVLASAFLPLLKVGVDFKRQTYAQSNASAAQDALYGYALIHGRLPCPASGCGGSGLVLSGACPADDLGVVCLDGNGDLFGYEVYRDFATGEIENDLMSPGGSDVVATLSGVGASDDAMVTKTVSRPRLAALFVSAGKISSQQK